MAAHSNILPWEILCTEEPGRTQSVGLQSQTQLNNNKNINCISIKLEKKCLHCIYTLLLPSLSYPNKIISFHLDSYYFHFGCRFLNIVHDCKLLYYLSSLQYAKISLSFRHFISGQRSESESRSVVFDSVTPWTPWNSPSQNTGECRLSLLQGSSQPQDQTQVSRNAGRFFTS